MNLTYSRENPSPRYFELQEQYRLMHLQDVAKEMEPSGKYFPGLSLLPHVHRIKNLVSANKAETLLDYGSGKGQQYEIKAVNLGEGRDRITIPEYWGIKTIRCYDPGYEPFNKLPNEMFDAVITTDMVEHCPEEDLPWILDELFSFAEKFVYINAADYPAVKILPNGENAHCTIKPPQWWLELIADVASGHPGVAWEGCVISQVNTTIGRKLMKTIFSNVDDPSPP